MQPAATDRFALWVHRLGRLCLAMLFFLGAVQKVADPAPVMQMLGSVGLAPSFVWPVAAFNLLAGLALVSGRFLRPVGLVLAAYCMVTSYFHFIPDDGWQMSIFVKNWAIAGGLLCLAAQPPLRADA